MYHCHSMHTEDTMLNVRRRVHIAAVGYEVDRIVIPAKKLKADRVWLLIHSRPHEDKATHLIERILRQLGKAQIEVRQKRHDRTSLFGIIRSIRDVLEAHEAESDVYVNLASGSKIQAVAGMMAAMMFNGRRNVVPFYAEAENYAGFEGKQISTGIKEIVNIPAYEIQTPESRLIEALRIVRENGGRITKKELAEAADEQKLISVRSPEGNYSQVRFTSLDKNIIQPLESKWGFVKVTKVGRNRWVSLTDEGMNASEFLL